jgi:SAM-dependent methyltransferase
MTQHNTAIFANSRRPGGPASRVHRWLCRNIETTCNRADAALSPWKEELFGHARGTVLEVGAGQGLNYKYLRHANNYWALDPDPCFWDRLGAITNVVFSVGAESIPLPNDSVDAVIASMALCSVRDLGLVVREIYRVLRPGGCFFLLEHVGAPRGTSLRLTQRLLRSACCYLDCGCIPDRDIENAVRSSPFIVTDCSRFQLKLGTPLVRDWIAATARKPLAP